LNPCVIKSGWVETFNQGIESINSDFVNDSGSLSGIVKSESIEVEAWCSVPDWANCLNVVLANVIEVDGSGGLRIGD